MKKRVGLILRPDQNQTDKNIFEIYDDFRKIIIENNCIPLAIVPNTLDINQELNFDDKIELINELNRCDGIICQGGDDFYNYDKFIVEYAIKKNIPILGICLGMQLMASIKENNLDCIQNNKIMYHKNNRHYVNLNKNSKLYKILGEERFEVNSFHKEYITSSGIYNISAYSDDKLIEGIEYNLNDFNIGVQWHPERDMNKGYNQKLFLAFFNSINKKDINKN